MRTQIIAIDHEGDNVPLDYETIEEARREIESGCWLRVVGEMGRKGLINPDAVYAVTEAEV